jgi:threonine dehydrogenase-like Zn-dependent dehydrogenase
LKEGDLVVSPFLISDGTCVFCREGLQTSCVHGGVKRGRYGLDTDGGQGEAVRVPLADGTLVKLPVERDDELMPSLLALTDVMGTGYHAARAARVRPGATVAIVGDGAVGLCGVISARLLGAERIILLGRHPARIALPGSSAQPTSSASAATRPSSACASSPTARVRTRSSSASDWNRRS